MVRLGTGVRRRVGRPPRLVFGACVDACVKAGRWVVWSENGRSCVANRNRDKIRCVLDR